MSIDPRSGVAAATGIGVSMRWFWCLLLISYSLPAWAEDWRSTTHCNDWGFGLDCRTTTRQERPIPARGTAAISALTEVLRQRRAEMLQQPQVIYVPQPTTPTTDAAWFLSLDPISQHRVLVQYGAKACPRCLHVTDGALGYCPTDGVELLPVADFREGALGKIAVRR